MSVNFDFHDKKVIITGAAGIFGTWIVEAFAKAGANIWLVDLKLKTINTLVHLLNGQNKMHTSSFDLKQEGEIRNFFKDVKHKWGSADFLINNAGIYPGGKLMDLQTELWDEIMSINVRAPYLMSKGFSELLINENKSGSIVNMISRSAKIPRIGAVPYAISKVSLEMMTRGMSMELAEFGIRVNAVSPGFAPGSDTNNLSKNYIGEMKKKIPLGRTSGPRDAPNTIMYLCSEAASFITGTSIYVDGGNSAGDFNIPINE